jgi:hypothetical protein
MIATDIVPSVSIANLVARRAVVIERITAAAALLQEAAEIAAAAHLGMPRVELSTSYSRTGYGINLCDARLRSASRDGTTINLNATADADIAKAIRVGVDASAWQYLMHESGMRSLMDAKAREVWNKSIMEGDIPELTDANIRSTFKMLHDSRGEIFERGVIACFRSLAWDYKTNLPQKFGKRMVITRLRGQLGASKWAGKKWGSGRELGHVSYDTANRLDDLSRVLSVLDGKPEPDHRQGWYARIGKAHTLEDPDPADDYMRVRCFRNGNGHVTFLRPDLVDRMNLIIAKHYPGALPAPK